MKKLLLIALTLILLNGVLPADEKTDPPSLKSARRAMVLEQIKRRGISDPKVLDAMTAVPRHFFVPENLVPKAYEDHPLPIGEGQTISQPYIVALMTEALNLKGPETVLEIGTGSGYQAAVLSKIAKQVYTIEIKQKLYMTATGRLNRLEFNTIRTIYGDGYFGLPGNAPFDGIMITAAVDHIPPSPAGATERRRQADPPPGQSLWLPASDSCYQNQKRLQGETDHRLPLCPHDRKSAEPTKGINRAAIGCVYPILFVPDI